MKATGIFTWTGRERRTNRYGSIFLATSTCDGAVRSPVTVNAVELSRLLGRRVSIRVTVLETRKSAHLGDLARQIFPTTPMIGEVVDLGTGTLFIESEGDYLSFGLKPDDDRHSDWFDPAKLYRLHDQTVELTIEPEATQ